MSGAKLSIWYWVFGAQCLERDMSKSREEVAAMREEYGSRELRRADLSSDPFVQFEQWFVEAREVEIYEPNAMVLSTVGPDGCPASRTVLLKFFDEEGFVFYTNYSSAKAKEMEAVP